MYLWYLPPTPYFVWYCAAFIVMWFPISSFITITATITAPQKFLNVTLVVGSFTQFFPRSDGSMHASTPDGTSCTFQWYLEAQICYSSLPLTWDVRGLEDSGEISQSELTVHCWFMLSVQGKLKSTQNWVDRLGIEHLLWLSSMVLNMFWNVNVGLPEVQVSGIGC